MTLQTIKQDFITVASYSEEYVKCIAEEDWGNSTPCSAWNLQKLVEHMAYELAWVPDLVQGKTIAEIGDIYETNLLDSRPIENYLEIVQKSINAVKQSDPTQIVHLSYGDVGIDHYVQELTTDILVHTWDVARSISKDYNPDIAITKRCYEFSQPREKELRSTGLFGKVIQVSDECDVFVQLLALYGRK